MSQEPRYQLVVIAAPSGGGKTDLVEALVRYRPGGRTVQRVRTATSRARRDHEVAGVDYDFHSREAMRELAEAGELIEWAEVHGEIYGTPRRNVAEVQEAGHIPVAILDVQGVESVNQAMPGRVLSVFLVPDRLDVLKERILKREPNLPASKLRTRLANAPIEVEKAQTPGMFTHVVDNLDGAFDATVDAVIAIVEAAFGVVPKRNPHP